MQNQGLDTKAGEALKTLEENRVAVFIVAYNAGRHIQSVLERIPDWVASKLAEIFVIDDSSVDDTYDVVSRMSEQPAHTRLKVFRTPVNQGYGGNQRLGFSYAIANQFDIVVLLHGDGQYAPEKLPDILAVYSHDPDTKAVFGTRFANRLDALKGGMPLYKWIGNQLLTFLQNRLLGTRMTEMHSGYRSYRVDALKRVPFEYNNLGFNFDSDIIIQFVIAGFKIAETPIPTYYGEEICHVNGLQYAWRCIMGALRHRMMQMELFYDPKFDIQTGASPYEAKYSPNSIHHYIRHFPFPANSSLLDVGGGDGSAISVDLSDKGYDVTCIDLIPPADINSRVHHQLVDLDQAWKLDAVEGKKPYDAVLALDVIEHLKTPESGIGKMHSVLLRNGLLIISTGNVAFLPLRVMLMLGYFNYGRRGILDMTHRRLFTISSFRRFVEYGGFRVEKVIGFGFPVQDILQKRSGCFPLLDRLFFRLANIWPSLFAYQILLVCRRNDSVSDLYEETFPVND